MQRAVRSALEMIAPPQLVVAEQFDILDGAGEPLSPVNRYRRHSMMKQSGGGGKSDESDESSTKMAMMTTRKAA